MTIASSILSITNILRDMKYVTVATSGGIDSMVLAYLANSTLGENAAIVHATSEAVSGADGQRVSDYALKYGWNLELVRTGEMANQQYLENPVNRCYYCKSCLFQTLTALNNGQVVTGTNLDDLDDYRPGLIAAKENGIRHPYVESNVDKRTIREIARFLELDDLSELPASPCLASRIETGIHIDPHQLDFVGRVEAYLRATIEAENVRCRILQQCIQLQVDKDALKSFPQDILDKIISEVQNMSAEVRLNVPVQFTEYKRGSAFIRIA